MNQHQLYGHSSGERIARENEVCRQIVREVNNFGISQRQTLLLIYLLASELENVEHMRVLTAAARQVGGDIFLIGKPEPDAEVTDGPLGV